MWRPEVVVPPSPTAVELRAAVRLAEPRHRPESVRAQVEAARSVLGSLAEARQTLSARVVLAHARAQAAETERARVSATIDAYRAEAELDEVLTMTSSQVSVLMKERGLR